jgi:hypothetical protein
MLDVIMFNLSQDGVKRSREDSAFYPNVPDFRVNKVGQQYRHHIPLVVCMALYFGGFLLAQLILGQRRLGQHQICRYCGLLCGQHQLCQRHSVFGQLLAKSLAGVVGQCFLFHGRLVVTSIVCLVMMLLVGIVGQCFILRSRLVVSLLVENGGIKLGHLCGSER